METRRLFSNRQKRERLKEEFEQRKLAKRLILNGYFFSLHDLRRYKLAFRCCRKASKKCRIRIYISWEELEKAGHYCQGGVRVAPEIKNKIDYDLRGQHSISCIAQNAILKTENKVSGLQNLGTAATETGFLVSQLEKNLQMTLDSGNIFCLQRSSVMEFSWRRKGTILLLGSNYTLECLMKCETVFVVEHVLEMKNGKKIFTLTFVGEFEPGHCVPGVHMLVELKGVKSIREGMKMIEREIVKYRENEGRMGEEEKIPKWQKFIILSNKTVGREVCRNLKCDVDFPEFDEDWEIQKKMVNLGIDRTSQIDIMLNLCMTLKEIGKEKGKGLYLKLIDQVKKDKNENYIDFIDFIWNDELTKIKKKKEEETKIILPYCCKRFFEKFKKELIDKDIDVEILINVLRYFELDFRQKLMEKTYKIREKMMRRGRIGRYFRHKEIDEDNPIEIESQDFIEEDSEDENYQHRALMDKIKGIDIFVNVI